MNSALMPYVARFIASDTLLWARRAGHELLRRARGREHRLAVYLRLSDPYSFLLLQALPELQQRFAVSIDCYLVSEFQADMYPRLDLLQRYALSDARELAELYRLVYPESYTEPQAALTENVAQRLVLMVPGHGLGELLELFQAYWMGTSTFETLSQAQMDQANAQLQANNRQLQQEGHYLGAMLHYAGEWYWGLDRLDHLERRLIRLGCARQVKESPRFDHTYCLPAFSAPSIKPALPPLTLFWSARSPYSYLALIRSIELARRYELELVIKPVLPMMMRNMFVPDTKKMYIFNDTKREAKKLGIPYGFVADPLGAAVERCYSLLAYAEQAGRLHEFLLSFASAVNAEGVRAETDQGMRQIVERCGLSWHEAESLLASTDWKARVDDNLREMLALGCWGVPTLLYAQQVFWGQDRIGMIELAVRRDWLAERPTKSADGLEEACDESLPIDGVFTAIDKV
jgi:2-hydroxychromene-2-carboxylate isomerase